MKVTFAHLDSMHIFCKAIEETAGIPYIVPPETSRKPLTLCILRSIEYGFWMGPLRTKFRGFDRNVFLPPLTDTCLPCTMLGSGPAGRQGRGASNLTGTI